jgi:hypothetical protein
MYCGFSFILFVRFVKRKAKDRFVVDSKSHISPTWEDPVNARGGKSVYPFFNLSISISIFFDLNYICPRTDGLFGSERG